MNEFNSSGKQATNVSEFFLFYLLVHCSIVSVCHLPVSIAGLCATASPIESTLTALASKASTSAIGPLAFLIR